MSFSVPTEMMDILRLTKTGNLIEATAAIQRALRGGLGQADDATHPVALDATQTSAGVWTTVQDQPSRSKGEAGQDHRTAGDGLPRGQRRRLQHRAAN